MQSALKGIWLPFVTALQAISDPFASCKKVIDYRIEYFLIFADFLILHAVSNPFLQVEKGIGYLLELEQKGARNSFK
jgi:hypothetical protein